MERQKLMEEEEEKDISITTMIAFLALVAGIILGYGWCWYHLGG